MKKLTEDEFFDEFTMVKNHINPNATIDGCMFETFGEEVDHVFELAKKENRVWTVIDTCEDVRNACNMVLTTGFHLVNRLGYIITKEPWTEEMEVILD